MTSVAKADIVLLIKMPANADPKMGTDVGEHPHFLLADSKHIQTVESSSSLLAVNLRLCEFK
jgi:hypothetical protein